MPLPDMGEVPPYTNYAVLLVLFALRVFSRMRIYFVKVIRIPYTWPEKTHFVFQGFLTKGGTLGIQGIIFVPYYFFEQGKILVPFEENIFWKRQNNPYTVAKNWLTTLCTFGPHISYTFNQKSH